MSKTIAFIHVTVIPMDSNRILENQNVIVSGDRITALGSAAATPIPENAQIIDGTNKFLMPGLADMHVHLSNKNELDLYLASGVTTVRNMWGWKLHLDWRNEIDNATLRGPHIITSGPVVDCEPPIWNGAMGISDPNNAEQIILHHIDQGFDFLKIYSGLSQEVYAALLAAAKKYNFPVAGHLPFPVGFERGLANPPRCFEHLMCYMDAVQQDDSPVKGKYDRLSRVAKIDHIDESKIPGVVETTLKSGVWNCPTLTVIDKLFVSLEQAELFRQRDEMKYVSRLTAASWQPLKDFRLKELNEEQKRHYMTHLPFYKRMTYELYKAGANLLVGSDAPNPFVIPGYSLHDELQLFVDSGIPLFDTLRIATYEAARYFEQEKEWGGIAPGMRADLVLLEADPCKAIENLKQQVGVMVSGHWHEQKQILDTLEKKSAARRRPPREMWFAKTDITPKDFSPSKKFTISYNDLLFGYEHIQLNTASDGTQKITSIVAMHGLSPVHFRVDIEMCKSGTLCSLEITSLSKHDDTHISQIFDCSKEVEQTFSSIVVLIIPLLSGYVPLVVNSYMWSPLLKNIPVGKSQSMMCREFEAYPLARVVDAQVTVKHESEYNYALTFTTQNANTRCDQQLDENNEPLKLEVHERLGEIVFKRD